MGCLVCIIRSEAMDSPDPDSTRAAVVACGMALTIAHEEGLQKTIDSLCPYHRAAFEAIRRTGPAASLEEKSS
jgi:hypothetical protein